MKNPAGAVKDDVFETSRKEICCLLTISWPSPSDVIEGISGGDSDGPSFHLHQTPFI